MGNGKNQYVVPTEGGWGVRGEGNSKLTVITETKAEAKNLVQELPKISIQN